MRAPPNLGPDYGRVFDAIYPELAARHGVLFYPFFLEGVAADFGLNQRDGMHPTADGIAAIVTRIGRRSRDLIERGCGAARTTVLTRHCHGRAARG